MIEGLEGGSREGGEVKNVMLQKHIVQYLKINAERSRICNSALLNSTHMKMLFVIFKRKKNRKLIGEQKKYFESCHNASYKPVYPD